MTTSPRPRPILALVIVLAVSCKGESLDPQTCDEPCTPASSSGEPAHLCSPLCTDRSNRGPGRTTAVQELMQEQLEMHDVLTAEELLARHQLAYLTDPDLSPQSARYHTEFVEGFGLDPQARGKLDEHGFVVLPLSLESGPSNVYYHVYYRDLPVFITADSILHAWHRSFDRILEQVEESILIDELRGVLRATEAGLDPLEQDQLDALFFVSVARMLLEPGPWVDPLVHDEVTRYMSLIEARAPTSTPFMGVLTTFDFSQMQPRGHYTHSEELSMYFQAMMWLGKTDLVLYSPDASAEPRPREEAAARALAGALVESGTLSRLDTINDVLAVFVGRHNTLDPSALLALCEDAGMDGCVGDADDLLATYRTTPIPPYTGRAGEETPALVMRFVPQRFAYDSWFLSQATHPRFTPEPWRLMPRVEEVAFALGSSRALSHMQDELSAPGRETLPGVIESSRAILWALPPTSLDDSVYNHWLEALMALSTPTVGEQYPRVMRTALWHDRKIEAALASWAELRHDTILYAEQSSSGVSCQYPEGYVEPVPCLFRSLHDAAHRMQSLGLDTHEDFHGMASFLEHWKATMKRLERMAAMEIEGVPWSCDEIDFINWTVEVTSICGDPTYDGWYPALYWSGISRDPDLDDAGGHPSALFEPVVTDVHTDLFTERALEVATGPPGLMIVAIDSQGELALYGGPVSSFYWFHQPVTERMTDEQWIERIESGDLPARPEFASSYWASSE